jgi:protein phosphatase
VAQRDPGELAITDVLGRRTVETSLAGRVTIREEQAAGALEVMSRFALDPRWLLHLPPTMAPTATGAEGPELEHPSTAFEFYRRSGVRRVVGQEKHMGSRAVVLVSRSAEHAAARFGVTDGGSGAVHTRTGRTFFDAATTERLLAAVRAAVTEAGLWAELDTDWLLLDAELLPWSAKAEELLRQQYAAVGAAARAVLSPAVTALQAAADRGLDVGDLLTRTRERAADADAFTAAYRRYVWPTSGLDGVRLAPFQLLATEGRRWTDQDHDWHLAVADRLVQADPTLFRTTRRIAVDTGDADSVAAGTRWWQQLTDAGGEGMVVKPLANLVRGDKGLVQPGVKVRGREYLRLIYGPDYTRPEHLDRLRRRELGRKRSLALREYALGVESLDRVVRREPLWRIHEAVFAVLALESDPVDPRL